MYKFFKRLIDLILGIIIGILLTPFMIVTYIVLKIDLGGKTFFKQERIGLNMTPFICYKFKSMKDDTTLAHNDRITRVSQVIRHSGLDELPQIFNIIKGDMSFVGPRPLMTNDKTMPEYFLDKKRYNVKPGVFGLAQYHGRRYITNEDKFKYDMEYVDKASLFLDFKLFFMCIYQVISQFLRIYKK